MYLRELKNANFLFSIRVPGIQETSPKKRKQWVHSFANLQSEMEYFRMLAAAYNRGPNRILDACKEYYVKFGMLPKSYFDLSKHTILKEYRITQCHVSRIAGLCGNIGGYMADYKQDFVFNSKTGNYEIP